MPIDASQEVGPLMFLNMSRGAISRAITPTTRPRRIAPTISVTSPPAAPGRTGSFSTRPTCQASDPRSRRPMPRPGVPNRCPVSVPGPLLDRIGDRDRGQQRPACTGAPGSRAPSPSARTPPRAPRAAHRTWSLTLSTTRPRSWLMNTQANPARPQARELGQHRCLLSPTRPARWSARRRSQVRPQRQRPGQGHPLPLTAGEFVRLPLGYRPGSDTLSSSSPPPPPQPRPEDPGAPARLVDRSPPRCSGSRVLAGSWGTTPIRRRDRRSRRPGRAQIRAGRPRSDRCRSQQSAERPRPRVDFPEPDSPTTPSTCPGATSTLTSCMARKPAGRRPA